MTPGLSHTDSPDVAKFRIVRESQLTNEAVIVYAKPPGAARYRTGQRSIWRSEVALEDAHLLFLAAYNLSRVEGEAVCGFRMRYPIDDDFILACRRAHEAQRRAAPCTNWRHRGLLSRCRLRAGAVSEQARDRYASKPNSDSSA